MDDEVLPILLRSKSMHAVRASQLQARYFRGFLVEGILTDLTKDLTFGPVVFVEIDIGCIASWTFTVVWYIAFSTALHRLYGLVVVLVTPLKVLHEISVIPRLHMKNQRKPIDFELLVFWGMGVIKSPLLERDVLTDKVYQPDILLIELLN